MTMNDNLSKDQFRIKESSITNRGAMPIDGKFNGPAPLKIPSEQNQMTPNLNIQLPKPGFF